MVPLNHGAEVEGQWEATGRDSKQTRLATRVAGWGGWDEYKLPRVPFLNPTAVTD